MRMQYGTVLRKYGAWTGRYSRWIVNAATGEKIRLQKSFTIGPVDTITKSEARRLLRVRIERELNLRSDSRITMQHFVETRWVPLRESTWRPSTKSINEYMLSHINKRFGTTAIEDCDAVSLQLFLDQLSKSYSGSLVRHVRILLKSIMADAVDGDFLRKNPARLLRVPAVLKPVSKTVLSIEQIQKLLSVAKGRDRIIILLCLICALRPSELFALRYRSLDVENGLLNITESVYKGVVRNFCKTTDENSPINLTQVFLPQELVIELVAFRMLEDGYPDDFIFSSSTLNKPLLKENFQHRNLDPLTCKAFHDGSCAKAGIKCRGAGVPKINYQVFRRTCSTHAQHLGSPTSLASVLRHSKVSTSLDHYVQPQAEATRRLVDDWAVLLLPPQKPT